MKILVVDVGGTHVKVLATGRTKPIKIPFGPTMTARQMVRLVRKAVAGWEYSVVSVGYPGAVLRGKPGRANAVSRPGHRTRHCPHRRRDSRTNGAGALALQEGPYVRRRRSFMERGHHRDDQRCRPIPSGGRPITVGEASTGRGATCTCGGVYTVEEHSQDSTPLTN